MTVPSIGSRVSVRYRRFPDDPDGTDKPPTEKPLTDVVGHVEAVTPLLLIRTKSDGLVEVAPDAVVSVRELSYAPVRNSQIRALAHAAALAWPGTEQHWLSGWFLRAGHGSTSRANSAVPLDFSADLRALPEVIDWYRGRSLPAWLALPERVLPVRTTGVKATRVLVRAVGADGVGADPGAAELAAVPDVAWLAIYQRAVPVDVLTAVVDGEVVFASIPGAAVGRGAVTEAPDGTRWLGISSVRVDPARRRQGHARRLCATLMGWGAGRGAQRAYVEVLADNAAAITLYESLGFRLHHSHRYVDAQSLLPHTI